jgi:predicted amidophosphoribosyltransferase
MGEAAAAIIVSAIPPNATIQLIPVPIGTTNRPYNQAQDIAEALISHIPQSSLGPTMRRKRNPAQTSVHTAHARRTNMEHVFVMDKLLDPSMFYIVVDDVRTTGATLEEARRALKASGARKVLCLAIAQTPLDS